MARPPWGDQNHIGVVPAQLGHHTLEERERGKEVEQSLCPLEGEGIRQRVGSETSSGTVERGLCVVAGHEHIHGGKTPTVGEGEEYQLVELPLVRLSLGAAEGIGQVVLGARKMHRHKVDVMHEAPFPEDDGEVEKAERMSASLLVYVVHGGRVVCGHQYHFPVQKGKEGLGGIKDCKHLQFVDVTALVERRPPAVDVETQAMGTTAKKVGIRGKLDFGTQGVKRSAHGNVGRNSPP